MEVFVAVVEAGSFVGAAERLGLSTAAVSRQVRALETRLDTRLLHRTTRRLSLTEEGRQFQLGAQAALEVLREAEDEISASRGEARGRLRLNVPVSFGLLRLAPLWPDFMRLYPGVVLDITLSDRLVDLVEEGYDLAVRIGRLSGSSLVARRLGGAGLKLCAAKAYLAERGWPSHPADLARHATISYSLFSAGTRWLFDGPEGEVTVRIAPVLQSNSGDTCVAAAIAGLGIVLQPDFLVESPLAAGELIELLPDHTARSLDIHAVFPAREHLPRKTRAMVDFLVERLQATA